MTSTARKTIYFVLLIYAMAFIGAFAPVNKAYGATHLASFTPIQKETVDMNKVAKDIGNFIATINDVRKRISKQPWVFDKTLDNILMMAPPPYSTDRKHIRYYNENIPKEYFKVETFLAFAIDFNAVGKKHSIIELIIDLPGMFQLLLNFDNVSYAVRYSKQDNVFNVLIVEAKPGI
ncbi:MAG: hypothetical protein DSY80_06970 [Desulfocapsa sp.]|nr:MAG: hypothetical protein DSY80_06970 [Desulfocapsa sp.]